MGDLNLQEICNYLIELAKEGGEIILCAKPSSFDNTSKKNTVNIITKTDKAVETLVATKLRAKYLSFNFIGEENYEPGKGVTKAPTFIVDPIDGTSNFIHSFPAVYISLGFAVDKKPTVGIVYNPFLDELYTAIRGRGAYTQRSRGELCKLPLNISPLAGLSSAYIGIKWGSDREGVNFELNLKVFTTLARTKATGGCFINSLRCTGSAALTICRIAAGQQDMFWECGSWAWDVAAAWCILNEAGGIIVDGHPGNWCPPIDNRRYLAVRPASRGQEDIVEQFWAVIGEDRSTYSPP